MLEIESIGIVKSDLLLSIVIKEKKHGSREKSSTHNAYKARLLWKDPCPGLPSNEGLVKKHQTTSSRS